jgi:hypothetical protein
MRWEEPAARIDSEINLFSVLVEKSENNKSGRGS